VLQLRQSGPHGQQMQIPREFKRISPAFGSVAEVAAVLEETSGQPLNFYNEEGEGETSEAEEEKEVGGGEGSGSNRKGEGKLLYNCLSYKEKDSWSKKGGKKKRKGDQTASLLLFQGSFVTDARESRTITFMIDSGASSNFISDRIVETLGLQLKENNCSVVMPNGERSKSKGSYTGKYSLVPSPSTTTSTTTATSTPPTTATPVVTLNSKKRVKLRRKESTEDRDTFVSTHLPGGTFDVILGMPWLQRINPSFNWKERRMTITKQSLDSTGNAVEETLEFVGTQAPAAASVRASVNTLIVKESQRIKTPWVKPRRYKEGTVAALLHYLHEYLKVYVGKDAVRRKVEESKAGEREEEEREEKEQDARLYATAARSTSKPPPALTPTPVAQLPLHADAAAFKARILEKFKAQFPEELPGLPRIEASRGRTTSCTRSSW